MLFMQRIIATFSRVSLETYYNAVGVINHITLRRLILFQCTACSCRTVRRSFSQPVKVAPKHYVVKMGDQLSKFDQLQNIPESGYWLLKQRAKTRHWLERYHFVVSTLALGLKINFDQPIKWMEFQKLADIKWLPVNL